MNTVVYRGSAEDRDVAPRLDEQGRQIRAVLMYSGGLDSTLAAIVLRRQGIDVVAVNMFTGFCLTDHKRKMGHTRSDGSLYQHEALAGAGELEIPVEMVDVRKGYLKVVTQPKHGWGKNVNPCIDCRIHMLGHARRLLDEYDAHFIATGEVLGQRPMTQMKRSLRLIEDEANLQGLIVRPLCQPLLWETIPEQKGWVDTAGLMRFAGRGRKKQLALAKDSGLIDFPQPAGGCCFLTDGNYAQRLRDLIDHQPADEIDYQDVLLLKVGRHFRLPNGSKLVIGRNHEENEFMRGFGQLGLFIEVLDAKGALGLFLGDREHADMELALRLVGRYCDVPADAPAGFRFSRFTEPVGTATATPLSPGEEGAWRLND